MYNIRLKIKMLQNVTKKTYYCNISIIFAKNSFRSKKMEAKTKLT